MWLKRELNYLKQQIARRKPRMVEYHPVTGCNRSAEPRLRNIMMLCGGYKLKLAYRMYKIYMRVLRVASRVKYFTLHSAIKSQ